MISKKTTMAVCGAVMIAASILASVPAYAETRQDVIAVTPGDEKMAVLFEFPSEMVDFTLISPSGKRYNLGSPDLVSHMDKEQKWRNYCVENAEAGPWSIEYDLKSNDYISYEIFNPDSIYTYDFALSAFRLLPKDNAHADLVFAAKSEDLVKEEYNYQISEYNLDTHAYLELTRGTAPINEETTVTLDYADVPEGKGIVILRVTSQDGEEILYDDYYSKTYTYSNNSGVDVSDMYVVSTGTLTPNGVVRDPDVPEGAPETVASQESAAATVTNAAEYQGENDTVYAKENGVTVQPDDADEAVDISIPEKEKELEQMGMIIKILTVIAVVIGTIIGLGICLLWERSNKKSKKNKN